MAEGGAEQEVQALDEMQGILVDLGVPGVAEAKRTPLVGFDYQYVSATGESCPPDAQVKATILTMVDVDYGEMHLVNVAKTDACQM